MRDDSNKKDGLLAFNANYGIIVAIYDANILEQQKM